MNHQAPMNVPKRSGKMYQIAKAVGRIQLFCEFGWVWIKMQRVKEHQGRHGFWQLSAIMIYAACKSTNLHGFDQQVLWKNT